MKRFNKLNFLFATSRVNFKERGMPQMSNTKNMLHSSTAWGIIGNKSATEMCPSIMRYPKCLEKIFNRNMRNPNIISANSRDTKTVIAKLICRM